MTGALAWAGVRLFGEALVHNVHYMTACVAPAAGCAQRTYNAHYVNIAWGCLFSGTSGTVVVVGVQRLFAFER